MKIRHRHFRRRREEKLAVSEPVHVLLKFRQLRRADHAFAPHQKRRAHFEITVLARVQIEHELDERPLQPRARAGKANEPAPAQLRRALQIEELQLRSERDVIERVFQLRLFSPTANNRIVARVFPYRRVRVRQIQIPSSKSFCCSSASAVRSFKSEI